jgi:hypothetical protein
VPPQSVSGAVHWHMLITHEVPPVHAVMQFPQWLLSDVRSAHEPEQSVGVPLGQPDVQANPVPDGAHTGVDPPQATPHAPQLEAEERSVSQPSVGVVEQCA